MRSRLLVVVSSLALVSSLLAIPSAAGTASISIDSVGGRKIANGEVKGNLSGSVLVQGAAVPGSAMATAPQPKPLVADAGDSPYTAAGSPVTLLGMGFGGIAPYTFSWTTSAGALDGATSPTARIDTSGVAPATYVATLSVTDSVGTAASDSVKFVLYGDVQRTLLDQTKNDATPGVLSVGVPGTINFGFDVPSGTAKFDVLVSWANALNDYDIRVLRPDGTEAIAHGDGAGVPERVSVANPVPGAWTLAVDKFSTITDNVRAQITGVVPPPDPRPSVRSGGPYRFAIGAMQAIGAIVTGGTQPVTVGWDTDQDGRIDKSGTAFTGAFAEGRQLITAKAIDGAGLERRETTSVLVATASRLAAITTAITVVAVNDSGINPYHLEFSAQTFPDPDVLSLTGNFQKHPSEYIPGYPKDAQAIPATLGQGYFPAQDKNLWDLKDATHPNGLEFGKLYWIPGTKIIGATQPAALSCGNCAAGAHVILDDDGHGSGSASVSTGNRYGYCPTCFLFVTKGLDVNPSAPLDWVDISSNSWGAINNAPVFLLLGSSAPTTRGAVERGQTVLFASGNGTAVNAFEGPSATYGTPTTGPDWNIVVGAIRRENERAIIGDGTPTHLSSWGDGNLPSACRTGTVSQCAFGGTSAATPYTAGIFGTVLTTIRRNIGDSGVGQRAGQVVAEGFPIPGSVYLSDGKLTRAELREAVLKTAFPLNQDNTQNIPIFPYPWTAPYVGDVNVLFEGYGAATPNSAKRAVEVLMGKSPLPVREAEDRWFAIDRQIRDSLWGGYDRDGNGTRDEAAALGAFGFTAANLTSADLTFLAIKQVTDTIAAGLSQTNSSTGNAVAYWLHRGSEGEPGVAPSCSSPVTYMDQNDTAGDFDPCFENRATTVLAAYRPVGIWPTSSDSTVTLPSGTSVQVELYLATDQVSLIRPTGVLMAGDRVLGSGAGTPTPTIGSGPWISQGFIPVNPNAINPAIPAGVKIDQNKCRELGELCWNKLTWSFTTTRPAVPGEQLTFQVQLVGARAWSFGYEGEHRSKIVIVPAAMPASGLDFSVAITDPAEGAQVPDAAFNAYGTATFPNLGTTEAGDHPTIKRVDVSIDDATFANPIQATLDESSGAWSAPIPKLAPGAHKLYARASVDQNSSPVTTRNITVQDTQTSPRVQWQVTPAGTAPSASGWQAASGLLSYAFSINTTTYGKGDFTISVRLLEGGVSTASTSLLAHFSGK